MIAIAIDRTSLTLADLAISDDGTGDWSVMPGYAEGSLSADNTFAESRWLDGAFLLSTREEMTSLDFTLKANTTSLATFLTNLAVLKTALAQFDYTVDVTEGAATRTFTCWPATWRRMFNSTAMLNGRDYVTVSIPRQP